MNERIGKLAEQAEEWVCKNYPDAMDDNDDFHAQTMEKFAELIVRECANAIVNDSRLSDVRTARNGCVRTIKEHFGVEE
jgi:hypothetical protein